MKGRAIIKGVLLRDGSSARHHRQRAGLQQRQASDRAEQDAILDAYMHALNMV